MSQKEKHTINKGDYFLIDYEIRIKDDNKLLDTTNEEIAKKEKFVREDLTYEPILLILNKGWFNKHVEEKLLELKEIVFNEYIYIELEPEKAFGKKDKNKIRSINVKNLVKEGIIPKVGQRIKVKVNEKEEKEGTVIIVSGGRAIIDFNHPLAGKTLLYKIKVIKKIEDMKEKITELLYRRMKPLSKEKIDVKIQEKILEIKFREDVLEVPNLQFALKYCIKEIDELFPTFTSIRFLIEKEKSNKLLGNIKNKY